jgi:hypothetical protein
MLNEINEVEVIHAFHRASSCRQKMDEITVKPEQGPEQAKGN